MYRWVSALFFACSLALALVLMSKAAVFRSPPTQAELEEARIFNADDAEWFGEDPQIGIEVSLVALADTAAGGSATLEVNGRRVTAQVGDTLLPPCLAVAAFVDDGILLDLCGGYELLKLSIAAKTLTLPSEMPLASAGRDVAPAIIDLRRDPGLRALLRDYRTRLYDKPLSLVGEIEVDVKPGENGLRRYFVFPGRDRRLFNELPLKAGDQVLAINGTPLSARESISDLYQSLDDARQLTVTLVRDEQDLVLLLDL